jgi:phosphomannomutase
MTSSRTSTAAQEWISHDPDPQAAAELTSLSEEELDERFARPLMFGTAGLRGPLRAGPNGMNLAVVLRTTWAVGKVLTDHGLAGTHVVVGRDTRHRSEDFALAAAEVLAAQGFAVTLMFAAVPTPVVPFAVRHLPAVAGIQITASHNPPEDNGYKVYLADGAQIAPPTDAEIEAAIAARQAARKAKDFRESDRIRDELKAKGVILEDGPKGTTWKRG